MANRNFDVPKTLGKGVTLIQGSFAPAGTGAVTTVRGKGFTVARTGVGTFTVTLDDKYTALLSGRVDLQMSAASALRAQLGAVDVTSARTIAIRVIDGTPTATDVAANTDNRVHFSFILSNTSVP